MSRHLVPPSSPPRLTNVLGAGAVQLRIGGALVATDKHTALSIRRAKGAREHTGQPAALSVSVNVDTPPTWRKGDKVTVELAPSALTALYGPQFIRSNYTPNPSFDVDLSGWVAVGGNGNLTRQTTSPFVGAGYARYTPTATKAANTTIFHVATRFGTTQAAAGQRWSGRLVARRSSTGSFALRAQLVAVSAAGVDLGVIAAADLSPGSAWTQHLIPSTAVAPAGTAGVRWVMRTWDETTTPNWVEIDAVMAQDTQTPPAAYVDGTLPSYVDGQGRTVKYLTEAAPSLAHREYIDGVPTAWAEARYRFVGRLVDVQLKTGRTGPATAQLVATGTQAQLGTTSVGDTPWPAELASTRAGRVLSLAKAQDPTLSYTLLPASDGPTLAPRDVDAQPAAQLLDELGESVGPLCGLVEKRDGSVAFGNVGAATFPAVWLTEQVTPAQLEHPSAPRINTVAVDLGQPPLGTVLRENAIPNPGIEVDTTAWVARNATIARDLGTFYSGVASLKITPTAGTADPGAYVQFTSVPGQRWRVRMKFIANLAGTYQLAVQHLNAAGSAVLSQEQVNLDYLASTGWTDIEVICTNPAPATTGMVRAYLLRTPTASALATQLCWIDRVFAYDMAVPGADLADYFDGSTPATPQATYAWTGTAGKSTSRQLATDSASQVVLTSTDAASVAAYGPYAAKVQVPIDWSTPATAYSYGYARGVAEYLSGGWQAPPIAVDVLALLADPTDVVTTTPAGTTKLAIAQALLRAELGSSRTLRYVVGDPAHVPPLHNVTAPITALDESITAHSWTVTTESERTT